MKRFAISAIILTLACIQFASVCYAASGESADALANMRDSVEIVTLSHRYVNGMFAYTFEDGRSFSVSVPSGGVANCAVSVHTDDELICLLTKDGSVDWYKSGDILTEEGYYHMRIISPVTVNAPDLSMYLDDSPDPYSVDMEALEQEAENFPFGEGGLDALTVGSTYQTILSFSIVTRPTRDIAVFNVPRGFEFVSVLLDGEAVEPSGSRGHRLSRDGNYVITLKDTVSSAPEQVVKFTSVLSPPPIRLEGVTNGFATTSAVTVATVKGAELTVYRNGLQAMPSETYGETGKYLVIARDAAGNTARASFEITFALPRSLVLAIILGVLIAGVGYVIYVRRSMVV